MGRIRLRHARPADLEALAEIHLKGFKDAHRGVIDSDYLLGMSGRSYRNEWRQALGGGGQAGPALVRITLVLTTTESEQIGASGNAVQEKVNAEGRDDGKLQAGDGDGEGERILGFAAVEFAGHHSRRVAPRLGTQLRKLYLSDSAPRRRGLGSLLLRAALLGALVLGEPQAAPIQHQLPTEAELSELCDRHFSQGKSAGGQSGEAGEAEGTSSIEVSAAGEPCDVGLAVWCLAGNEPACRFYEAAGMERLQTDSVCRFGQKRYAYAGYGFKSVRKALETQQK